MENIRQHAPKENHDLTRWSDIPTAIRDRLAGEGIFTAEAWRALSARRRRAIFGITPSIARRLDAAARDAT